MRRDDFDVQVGGGKVVKVTGVKAQGRTATVLLRGSNKLVLEEAERSLHDALCVIRCLVHKRALVPGGAAPEMAVEHALTQWAKTLQVGATSARPASAGLPELNVCPAATAVEHVLSVEPLPAPNSPPIQAVESPTWSCLIGHAGVLRAGVCGGAGGGALYARRERGPVTHCGAVGTPVLPQLQASTPLPAKTSVLQLLIYLHVPSRGATAEDAAPHCVQIVTELRNKHARGESHAGINVRRGSVTNMLEERVVQPLLVSTSALTLATECVRMILKIGAAACTLPVGDAAAPPASLLHSQVDNKPAGCALTVLSLCLCR